MTNWINALILFLVIVLMGCVTGGCASLGVPVSICDAQDQAICRAEYAAEQQVNTAVDFADENVCVDLNFQCPDRDPDCGIYDYCAGEQGAGDFVKRSINVIVD